MPVTIMLFGAFADGTGSDSLERDAPTVRALLTGLEQDYAALDGALLDPATDEGIDASVVVTVAKRDVRHLDGLDTALEDGDTVRITKNAYPRR